MKNKILFFVLGIFLISFVSAISYPHAFHGTIVYSNGTIIQEGTITAKINELEVGSCNIVNGLYDLVVESDNNELIYFYIQEKEESIGNYKSKAFEITELNFIIETQEPFPENETEPSNNIQYNNFIQICDSNWKCSSWSSCFNGIKTRQCHDTNNCKVSHNKPIEETSCTTEISFKENKISWFFILTSLLIFVLLIWILVVLLKK